MIRYSLLALLLAAPLPAQQTRTLKPGESVTVTAVPGPVVHDTVCRVGWSCTPPAPPPDTVKPPPPDTTQPPPPVSHKGLQVTPGGTSSGDGSPSRPLSLAALLGGARAQPGDTAWLREGTYTGTFRSVLRGTAAAPIIVRAWPGESAVIKGTLAVDGAYTWFWGLEVANADPTTQDRMGVDSHGPGTRFINMIVHDHSGNGFGLWAEAPDAEVYGSIVYNNGFCGSGAGCSSWGHGIYAQNSTGTKKIRDNIILGSYGYGLHLYTEQSFLKNFTVDGNVAANSGQPSGDDNFLVGGSTPVSGLVFTHNYSFSTGNAKVWLGRASAQNADAIVRGNVFVRGNVALRLYRWTSIALDSNKIVGSGGPGSLLDQQGTIASWKNNQVWGSPSANEVINGPDMTYAAWKAKTGLGAGDTYTSGAPTGQWVYVRPNLYEKGRANVIVFNWSGGTIATVDLTGILRPGQAYEVRNTWRIKDPPVLSGTYSGPLRLPLAKVEPYPSIKGGPARIGTGTQFMVFVVLPR